jgi:hypothetical protein
MPVGRTILNGGEWVFKLSRFPHVILAMTMRNKDVLLKYLSADDSAPLLIGENCRMVARVRGARYAEFPEFDLYGHLSRLTMRDHLDMS